MTDVFISYSRADKDFVEHLIAVLHLNQKQTWIDWEDIPRNSLWWKEIERGIEGSDNFVCVVSPNWFRSYLCQLEFSHALKSQKKIIAVVVGNHQRADLMAIDIQPAENIWGVPQIDPERLKQRNWGEDSHILWVFRGNSELEPFLEGLIEAISGDPDYIRQHTEYFQSALKWENHQRKSDYLLMGEAAHTAFLWLQEANKAPYPTELHRHYILESWQLWQKRQQGGLMSAKRVVNRFFNAGPRKIFISYRRADSADACGRIYDRLEQSFGSKNIFLDVDSIDYGADFAAFIQNTLKECFAMLVVVGPKWLETLKEREAEGEVDYVKIEVESGLKRHHINVIPLFIGGIPALAEKDLPPRLRNLALRNGTSIRSGRDFHRDMDTLIVELKKLRKEA